MIRVIGIGREFAGDDGVGPHVIALLRASPPPGIELAVAREPSELVDWLRHDGKVVIVDAVLDPDEAGQLRPIPLDVFDATPPCSLSSHGIGVREAVELCRALHPDELAKDVVVLAIGVAAPRRFSAEMSPEAVRGAKRAEIWIRTHGSE